MEKILSHLNYKISSKDSQSEKIGLIIVNNPDGSPRWVCNAKASSPLFLKFYLISSLKSRLLSIFFRLVFKFRLQKILLNYKEVYVERLDLNKKEILDLSNSNWALFTGTVGPNNKMLVYKELNSGSSFFKVATTPISSDIIKNEYDTLKKVEGVLSANFLTPKILSYSNDVLEIEDLSYLSERENKLTSLHADFINKINKVGLTEIQMSDFFSSFNLEEKVQNLKKINDSRIPKGILRKLDYLINSLEKKKIKVGLGHGDFTPWNIYLSEGKIGVYDWELSKDIFPVGFDAFHFIFQQNIMVSRTSWKSFKEDIFNNDQFNQVIGLIDSSNEPKELIKEYLKYYLLINIIDYLHLYSKQEKWHVQIFWLLETWNDALSYILESDFCSERGLFIIDFFDFINDRDYATIKFHDNEPELLSVYSDIDICINKSELKSILGFLNNNQFVKKVEVVTKSNMYAVSLLFNGGEVLALDFIWSFKRKSVVFLEKKEVLDTFEVNNFGVKCMNKTTTAQYVGCFYGLNGVNVPKHYLYLKGYLNKDDGFSDTLFHFYGEKGKEHNLSFVFQKYHQNQGVNKYFNKVTYLFDVIRSLKVKKGLIVTFSGVDGAGKSTIIENVKKELEKKHRKKVVVIRHRPSLLPILSAWTKGKEQAEQDAANTLPRQGQNSSFISSLVRFSYYYLDYLIGQFYVNFKYKYRGVVVLYDRYYYDFILDSKRSNITLPKSLVKFGFNFVFTPNCNFFLFASPEVILKRKQELSAETIIELTKNYSDLFNQLEKRRKKENYFLINNIDLDVTMKEIMKSILNKLS